jgi:hypothetical protein
MTPMDTGELRGPARPPARTASKCPCCARKAVRLTVGPGRTRRYRNVVLTLPADLLVPTCGRCKHLILTFESVPALEACLEATYRADLCQRAAAEIVRLGKSHSQRQVEGVIDLSQGYLSRLRAGDGVPSAALVSLLALLAAEPARLDELKRYWALPAEAKPCIGDEELRR